MHQSLSLILFISTQSLAPIGALFGSFIGGFIADALGRKAALLLVTFPYMIDDSILSIHHGKYWIPDNAIWRKVYHWHRLGMVLLGCTSESLYSKC